MGILGNLFLNLPFCKTVIETQTLPRRSLNELIMSKTHGRQWAWLTAAGGSYPHHGRRARARAIMRLIRRDRLLNLDWLRFDMLSWATPSLHMLTKLILLINKHLFTVYRPLQQRKRAKNAIWQWVKRNCRETVIYRILCSKRLHMLIAMPLHYNILCL